MGGVVFIALVTFLIWFFFLRHRRSPATTALFDDDEEEDEAYTEKPRAAELHASRRAATSRASMHTVHSLASSVLTRASNVIQIAFIPGITDRNAAPPVPPIPIPTRSATPRGQASTYAHSLFTRDADPSRAPTHALIQPGPGGQQDHYFLPGDLASNYSYDATSAADAISTADAESRSRHSLTSSLARASMTSTIYRDDAVLHPLPAQTALRGRAAVVTVPAVPQTPAEYSRYGQPIARRPGDAGDASDDDDDDNTAALRVAPSLSTLPATDSDSLNQHPATRSQRTGSFTSGISSGASFFGMPDEAILIHLNGEGVVRPGSHFDMAAAIGEATRRAAHLDDANGREESPFGDEHEV